MKNRKKTRKNRQKTNEKNFLVYLALSCRSTKPEDIAGEWCEYRHKAVYRYMTEDALWIVESMKF